MYEGALPTTGIGVGVAGQAFGLSWLLAIGVLMVVGGIVGARYTRRRAKKYARSGASA